MNTYKSRVSVLALALAAATVVAQTKEEEKRANAISRSDEPPLNHFGVAYRAGFNIKPSFKNIGGLPNWINRDPAQPRDRTYTDGYVRVDRAGNIHANGLPPFDHSTWFWAYADEATQSLPVPGSILMHIDSSAPIASTKGECDEPLSGYELTYNRQLGKIGMARWGLEAAFGYMGFNVSDRNAYVAPVSRRTDRFLLLSPGQPPGFSPDPYNGSGVGTFNGPGSILADEPTPPVPYGVANNGNTLIEGQRHFDGSLLSGRLGPYLEIPISEWLSVSFSGGLALVGVQSTFSYDERLTIPTIGTEGHKNSGSHGDVLVGGYVSGNLSVALGSQVNLFAGVQFQNVGTYTHPLDNVGTLTGIPNRKAAELDLRESVFVVAGVSIGF